MDRHRRTMQKRRPHRRGRGDEGLILIRAFNLDDRGRRNLRIFGPHHMDLGKARPVARPEIDHLRALDQPARLQINPLLAVLQRQFDPVANQRLARQQLHHRARHGRRETR